jgi:hypothetical protein
MNRILKATHCITWSTVLCAVVLAAPGARAQSIIGSVGFAGSGVTVNNPNLALATSFTVGSAFTTTETGTYASVPLFTPATFNGFTFQPAVVPSAALWTFTVNAITYSFTATTILAVYDSTRQEWDMGGNGTAKATGFNNTPGSWNVNLSQSGASFVFDSSAASSVPEPSTIALGALGASALLLRRRRPATGS